jgi:CHAT domain-containing protein
MVHAASGEFVFAPVHAAGVYEGPAEEQECCSDYVVSSYTPTLSALRRAQDGPVSRTRSELAVLAVAEGRATNLPFLANAAAEAEQVIHIAQAASVDITAVKAGSPSTTIDNLKTSLSAADIVHLSCHGVQDQEDPLLSGFCFGDGKLTVNELVQLNLPRAWVAFMSACETAKGDHEQPDQTVHLAAAMLFCGFRSVIGTMWCVVQQLQEA